MVLIENWKQAWRFWSIRFEVLGLALLAFFQQFPETVAAAWIALPQDIRATFDPTIIQFAGYGLLVLGIGARLIKQKKLEEKT